MTLSRQQAAAALQDIEQTEQRTYRARGYAIASPYLILWGLIWVAGYGACAVLPAVACEFRLAGICACNTPARHKVARASESLRIKRRPPWKPFILKQRLARVGSFYRTCRS